MALLLFDLQSQSRSVLTRIREYFIKAFRTEHKSYECACKRASCVEVKRTYRLGTGTVRRVSRL